MKALVDFKGFRLICVSKLPINKKTIVYGSSDGNFFFFKKKTNFKN